MITAGVDLAAEPAKTALAVVRWDVASATVTSLALDITDLDIVGAATGADRMGIDAPFGWPDAFATFVANHHAHQRLASHLETREQRRPLTKRRTDLVVQQESGIVPLSVSADRIAHVALRCAGILDALQLADRVDGYAVEAYPAAALRHWGLRNRGYKGTAAGGFDELVTAFLAAAPWLELGEFATLCHRSDDAFDAVITALIARAVALRRTASPSAEDHTVASREGWIHVPTCSLDDLVTLG